MRGVEFHTGLADPLGFACRLLRKAQRQGHRMVVTAPSERLAELDSLLWTFEALAFVPHVRAVSLANAALVRTPVWLCEQVPKGEVPAILVNLGAAAPADPARFERLIEIVSHQPEEAQAGRERWRAYKAQGLTITHHPAEDVG
jgi:DNA polymerase-3 subunit chi